MTKGALFSLFLLMTVVRAGAGDTLTSDEVKLLQDSGGWEYLSLSDQDNGIQTQHTCFDGKPHPNECSGILVLTKQNTFTQTVHIHGQSVQRHGSYTLSGNQITFVDELQHSDGPYTIALDTPTKCLVLQMQPVRVELELEREYRRNLLKGSPQQQPPSR